MNLRLILPALFAVGLLGNVKLVSAATLVPYLVALDGANPNRIDVYNPQGPGGTATPVEFFDATFSYANAQSGVQIPAHLTLASPTGTNPGQVVYLDYYFDGDADAFPTGAYFNSTLDFLANGYPHGTITASGDLVIRDGQLVLAGYLMASYPPPIPSVITHEFDFYSGNNPTNPNVHINGPGYNFIGSTTQPFNAYVQVSHTAGLPVDPSQPIVRIPITVIGVPEPSSIALAVFGVVGLACAASRREACCN